MTHCITSLLTGFWRTRNCGQDNQSFCKRAHSTPANTTAAPTVPPKGGCPLKWKQFDSKVRNECQSQQGLVVNKNNGRLDHMAWKPNETRTEFGCRVKIPYFICYLQCYSINSVRRTTWEESRSQCITIGGNLVSVPTRRVQGLFVFF